MKKPFRDYIIKRTCTKKFKNYRKYLNYLKDDFKNRCAYCNLLDTQITTPFEVDHFVPKKIFEIEWPDLLTTYANLVYSCKNCNIAKSDQYDGDIKKHEIKNELFYDPEEVDYGKIFYRGENGGIYSDDKKGKDMINRLKLYRPIHNLAWICEITKTTLDKLSLKISSLNENSEMLNSLKEAKMELQDYYEHCCEVFIANYNNKKFIW